MAETTGIAWTTSTFNPWIGCTEVSPGCDNCYARTLDKRHRWGGATHWGAGVPRHRTTDWSKPLAWNRKAEAQTGKSGRWTVFPSLCDPFDNEVPREWRMDLFTLIEQTPRLTWLLLTKRIGNVHRMVPFYWLKDGDGFRPNVWIGASIVNQEEADRDLPKLLATPAAKRFVSYEPALGPVDFSRWLCIRRSTGMAEWVRDGDRNLIDWIIVGGESSQGGAKARPFYVSWARSTRDQCRAAGTAFFFKQAGSFVIDRNDAGFDGCEPWAWPEHIESEGRIDFEPFGYTERAQGAACRVRLRDRAGADPAEWPSDLRIQEFPT